MKRLIIVALIVSFVGCGYGMYYTKAVKPIPQDISHLRVTGVKDIEVAGKGSGKTNYVRSILLSALLDSKRFTVNENARHSLVVSIDGYQAGYRKYLALSAQLLDTSTDQVIWTGAISGVSKKYIDEVVKNVVLELVKEMSGGKKGQR